MFKIHNYHMCANQQTEYAIYIKDRTPRQWTKKLSEPLIETSIYIFNMIKDWLFEINRKREIPHGDEARKGSNRSNRI